MTSPATSRSPSPATPALDDKPAQQTEENEEQSPSDEDDEDGQSPEPQSPPAESSTSEAQAASESVPAAGTASTSSSVPAAGVATASAGDWQAVWSPQHNAYYFYNSKTQETTWKNPLEPEASSSASAAATPAEPEASTSTSAAVSSMYALQAAAAAQGIDPSLAYLDPSLAASTSSNPQAFTYTAKFNARTGAFAKPDGRDPNHVSEYERARRMSEAYFDVGQWEKDLAERDAQEETEGKKRKKPTKKDLVRNNLCPIGGSWCSNVDQFLRRDSESRRGRRRSPRRRGSVHKPYLSVWHLYYHPRLYQCIGRRSHLISAHFPVRGGGGDSQIQ